MAADSEDPHISTIVRRYSDQVAARMPGNTLAQALDEHEVTLQARDNEADEWREWLKFDEPSSDDEMSSLREVAKEAAELWRKLKLDLGDLGHDPDSPPSVKNLSLAVSEAQHAWEQSKKSGLGKAKERFSSFLQTMDQYKYLFSIIPKGDKYTSLFTGVLSTVVKASTNNEHLAEGFSEALQDMGRDMHLVQRMSKRCDTPSMRQCVISLYREVFTFLCHAMKWYQSKPLRLRKAFNHKFYDETVKNRVKRIQGHLQRIRDEMNLMAGDNLQSLSERQERSFEETNYHIDAAAEWVHDGITAKIEGLLDQKFAALARLLLGKEMSSTLYANAEQVLAVQNLTQVLILGGSDAQIKGHRVAEETTLISTKSQLEAISSQLEKYASSNERHLSASESSEHRPVIPSEVAIDLQRWLISRVSSFLWIESPAYVSDDGELANLALRVSRLANQSSIPCIDLYIERTQSFEGQELSQKEESLIVLVYSLLKRLIMSMPTRLDTTNTLSRDQFLELDGSFDSIPKALKIIQQLLEMMAPGLIVVVYAFDLVDGRDTRDALVQLIHILQDQPPEKRVKVLVISRGRCISLLQTTRPDERSDATRMVLARGSSPLPGGMNARDIELPRSRY